MSDSIWETFDQVFRALHRQGRRVEELEARVAELERRLAEEPAPAEPRPQLELVGAADAVGVAP